MKVFKSFFLLALVLALGGCGSDNGVSKNNTIENGSSSSGGDTWSYGGTTTTTTNSAWSSDVAYAVSTYSGSIACTYGGSRNTIVSYYINSTSGLGVYSVGYLTPVLGDIYLGRSVFGDLMAVQKVGTGNTVTGFNVYLELCDFSSYGVPLIGGGRAITNLGIELLSLGASSTCTYDLVLKAAVWLEVGAYGSYPATSFPTSFFPIDTNLSTGKSVCNNNTCSYYNPYGNTNLCPYY